MEQQNYEEIEQSLNNSHSQSTGFGTNALLIRLETTKILEDLELFLRGGKIIVEQDQVGNVRSKKVKTGISKANDSGVQAILSQVGCIINPQVVQGNFYTEEGKRSQQFENYVVRVHKNLAENLMTNLEEWEISEQDYNMIIDTIMDLIEPFMSRLIDNKERESYEASIRHVESNTIREGSGKQGFGLFGK